MEKKENQFKIITSKNGIDVVEDEELGYAHVTPLPSAETLTKLYEDEYYQLDKKEYLERNQRDEEWNNLNHQDKFDFFEEQLGRKGSVLDIGSGFGHFIAFGKNIGWATKGIEPSKIACEYANNDFKVGTFNGFYNEETAALLGLFDVVHLRNVLEHLPNPLEVLELCKKNLKEDGIICVSVPNDFSPFQKIANQELDLGEWWVVPNHHLNYFNPTSLERVLKKVGYEPIRKEASFPLTMFLMMGDNYIRDGELGRICHEKRKAFDLQLSKFDNQLRRDIYQFFAEKNIGRECIVYARKNN